MRQNVPHSRLDRLGLLCDGHKQLIVREDGHLSVTPVALDAVPVVRQPVGKREVNGLVEVELNLDKHIID